MSPVLVAPYRFGAAPPTNTYTSEILADSPLAYYRLGDSSGTTMTDSSGNSRNGTYTGVTLGTSGAIGDGDPAITTAGTTSSQGTTAFASWMTLTSAVTLEAWIKTTTASGGAVFLGRGGGSNSNYWLGIVSGKASFQTRVSSNTNLTGLVTINDGNWHHVVGTYDGSVMSLYVDGVLDNATGRGGTLNSSSNTLVVGCRGTDAAFAGVIDEAAVYGTTLTDTRVAAHFAAR